MTYWEKRGAQLEQLADRRTRITAQKVAHLYDEALERIEQKIQKIYATFTDNSHITEAEATRLMSVQQTKEARRELEALLERTTDQTLRQELITQLNAPAYGYRIAALEALRDQVYFEAKAIGNDSVAYTESRLKDLYDLGYYRTAFDLSQYEGSNVPFSQLSGGRVEAAINAYWTPDVDTLAGNYSTRIWADTTQLAENVRDIVTRGLMTGGNYADMAAELAAQMGDVQFRKKVDADGGTRTVATGSGAKYRATRLIRTEGNYITGQAKLQSMRDAGYEKYEFICLLETRTCSVCGGLDGKQFPVAEAQPGVNMNPMHPNCRCFVSPVVSKRLMEAGTRGAQVDASGRKETVPASMTYQEWYEKYVKGTELEKAVAKRPSSGIINYAKAIDSMFLVSENGTAKFTPEDIINEMETSYIGRQAEKWIEESPIRIVYQEDAYGGGNRGEQRRNSNIINIYPRNIRSNRVAAQTVIHEMGHYHYGIGGCQHAEAICFGLEKLHLTGKEKLTGEEWAYVKQLAIDNYPEYEWEEGGYGDFSKIHIHD